MGAVMSITIKCPKDNVLVSIPIRSCIYENKFVEFVCRCGLTHRMGVDWQNRVYKHTREYLPEMEA